ncbi:MerR family transcriptional regulator [Pseudarthrobacter sp. PS3-L1]|uniref:MerR family transcriptional regulator n=1 Tax=Pseudarthrobacter sp. PS3-L1 TaxID=3046207 RepID=UPI0024BB03DF|nr:MerR family transcriptional regulator [Pseudarthrobacter sp. PS3-L1]MDJ0318963.1 MerR family transcriptional regulator [Pseudarthrobacter sp. PS3-L1]
MPWSTREVADLAGTTVNTIRHYHRSGLLEEPERMTNGYKKYGARHLVRLLQIRRLRDLGVPLAQIESIGFSGEPTYPGLLGIEAELSASITRLQRARTEIQAILQGSTTTDVPAGFEEISGLLSGPERSLMLIYSQLYDEAAMADLKQMVESEPREDDANEDFNTLQPDADEATKHRLAATFAPLIAQHLADYPWLVDQKAHLSKSPQVTQETFVETMTELYNPAQLEVLAHASVIATQIQDKTAANAVPNDTTEDNERTDVPSNRGDNDSRDA